MRNKRIDICHLKFCQAALMSFALALFSTQSMAQDNDATSGTDAVLADSLESVYIVGGMMGAGAILGLSTLSFYEEPGDHLKNIVTGGAIGIIIGVGIVGYLQATKSQESVEDNLSYKRNHWRYEAPQTQGELSFNWNKNSKVSAMKNGTFLSVPISF
ncbi:MAG: hypothetical protein ACPGJV_03180 [Bacteriovoracaceae bacterium]